MITRERLEELASFRGAPVTRQEEQEMARRVLTAEAQESVGVVRHVDLGGRTGVHVSLYVNNLPEGAELYAAPQSVAVPDGYVLVPNRLTAENGAKSAISGEFSETKFINCPECFGDEECETCDGSGRIEITLPVTWTNIKAIWEKAVEHFAAAPVNPEFTTQLVGEVVAWHHPNHERNVDFRWLDFNVEPGTKLYAIKQERG